MDIIIEFFKNCFTSLDGDIANITNILKEDWFRNGNDFYDLARYIQWVVTPIALTIVTICFLIEFLKITIQMDVLKWEYGLRCFFKLVFAKVCIDLSTDLLGAIYITCAEWIDEVGTGTVHVGQTVWTQLESSFTSAGLLESIGFFLAGGLIVIAIKIITIVIQVMAYARKFEISILLAIAPLPCAFLPLEDGGTSRIPKKYIMSFASSCLAGFFMIISVRFYAELVNGTIIQNINNMSDFISKIGQVLLATLVLVMAVIKSGSWASKVLDVG
ncbi:MAG: type IV secretion system protein [Alphaproteobacteria bacterium]|nr:type IV secretion system protein [Alphaproteobacteria bacterium]